MKVISNRLPISKATLASNLEINTVDFENYEVVESIVGYNKGTLKLTRKQLFHFRDVLTADVRLLELAYRIKQKHPIDLNVIIQIIDDSLDNHKVVE